MSRFTKDTFSEKWKILITKENIDIVTPYYAKVSDTYTNRSYAINKWIQSHNFANQLPVKGAGTSFFGSDNDDEFTKITIEEFKEFVLMEKFTLPEKWAIKDCKKVALFAHEKWGCVESISDNYYHHGANTQTTVDYCFQERVLVDEGFIEITYEQFIKYVFNQEIPKEDHSQLIKLLNDAL